jgi:nitroimidazol reductase NimA-like FMN-containing flavoprotein (pyridoxamine 5'-phosphate oxidase superfamily)
MLWAWKSAMVMRHESEILSVLKAGKDLTLATLMADGSPHATTVSYASQGATLYFGCDPNSQKAQNLARDDRVAATITLPYRDWSEILGLSLQGRARRLATDAERADAERLFMQKFDEIAQFVGDDPRQIDLYILKPQRIVLLDYRRGFGHVDYDTAD